MLPTVTLRDVTIVIEPDNADPALVQSYRAQVVERGRPIVDIAFACDARTAPEVFELARTTVYQRLTQLLMGQ